MILNTKCQKCFPCRWKPSTRMFEPALKTRDLQANEKQMESMKKEEEAKKADSIVSWEKIKQMLISMEENILLQNENNSRCSKRKTLWELCQTTSWTMQGWGDLLIGYDEDRQKRGHSSNFWNPGRTSWGRRRDLKGKWQVLPRSSELPAMRSLQPR